MDVINILNDVKYDDEDIVITDLFDTEYSKEISIALQKHQFMKEYESEYALVLHVIYGSVKLITAHETIVLIQGDLIPILAQTKHTLEALDNSLLRVSLFI
jgi:quercetin dioxygenase-like cupin family protein